MSDDTPQLPQPRSLGDHVIPQERVDLIRQHVAMLSETALEVGDSLPFSADASDLVQILNAEPEKG